MTKKWQKKLKIFLSAEKNALFESFGTSYPVLAMQILRECLRTKNTVVATLPDSSAADRLTAEVSALIEKLNIQLEVLAVPECGRGRLLFPGGESHRARALDNILNQHQDLIIGSINSLLGPAQAPA